MWYLFFFQCIVPKFWSYSFLYVDVTSCYGCFIKCMVSSRNYIYKLLPIQNGCIYFSGCSDNENGYSFVKTSKKNWFGDFSTNCTSECKKVVSTIFYLCIALHLLSFLIFYLYLSLFIKFLFSDIICF